MKHIVTQEDLQNNPDLLNGGVRPGEEIEIPDPVAPVEELDPSELATTTNADGPGPRPGDKNNPKNP